MKTLKFTDDQTKLLRKIITYRLAYIRNLKNEARPGEERRLIEILQILYTANDQRRADKRN